MAGTGTVTEADHDDPAPETVIETVTGTGLEVGTAGGHDHVTGGPGQGHVIETGTETERGAGADHGRETEKGVEVGQEKGRGTERGTKRAALHPLPR